MPSTPPTPPPPGAAASAVAPVIAPLVLWLHYEDLLRDPAHEARAIAASLARVRVRVGVRVRVRVRIRAWARVRVSACRRRLHCYPSPHPKLDAYPHPNEVRAIASFLGLDATDTALIARVVEGSSFASMREAAVAAEALTEGARAAEGAGAEGTAAARSPSYEVPGKAKQLERRLADHLRKGEVGDWRTHFEPYPELLEAFEAAFAREMRGCAGRRWDCGGGKVMTVCTDTR